MVETQKSVADLLASMPVGVTAGTSVQDMRDLVVSSLGIGGELWIPPFAGAGQAFTANTPARIALWTSAQSWGVTASAVTDGFTILVAGRYRIVGGASFSSSAPNVILDFRVRVNNIPTDIAGENKIATGGDVGGGSFVGPTQLLSPGDVVDAWIEMDSNTTITMVSGNMSCNMVA